MEKGYLHLLTTHSHTRWLVVLALVYLVFRAWQGRSSGAKWSKADNITRIVAVLLVHLQAIIGYALYFVSPITTYFRQNITDGLSNSGQLFFGLFHLLGMTVAVVLLTIGSAKAKRATTDADKFNHLFVLGGLALIVLLLSVPWPFYPGGAARALFRAG